MNAENLLDAIGMIDDECIQNAKPKTSSFKQVCITIGSLAACLGLIMLIPILRQFGTFMNETDEYTAQSSHYTVKSSAAVQSSVAVVTSGEVWIYYVDGDTVSVEKSDMSYAVQDIFAAWKRKNGIGEEVKLIDWKQDSQGDYSTTLEFEGKEYIKYTLPNYFILHVTVSKNIENYYDKIDSKLLLKSLEETMKLHHRLTEYDEYYLILE